MRTSSQAEYIDAAEVARRLDLSRGRIYSMARDGEIPSLRFGRYLRFRWDSVVEKLREAEKLSGTQGQPHAQDCAISEGLENGN